MRKACTVSCGSFQRALYTARSVVMSLRETTRVLVWAITGLWGARTAVLVLSAAAGMALGLVASAAPTDAAPSGWQFPIHDQLDIVLKQGPMQFPGPSNDRTF